jgi:sulfonate transport system permease protein
VSSLWASLQRVVWGTGSGLPIGTGLALVAGLSRWGGDLVDANVQMLRFVPIHRPAPCSWCGSGSARTVKIALIVLGVAFPIYVNTSSAIRALDLRYHELAEVVGLGRQGFVRRIVLPGALPGFLVACAWPTAVAWLLLVFAEQINATSGIGFLMSRAQNVFSRPTSIVVGLVC